MKSVDWGVFDADRESPLGDLFDAKALATEKAEIA